MYTNGVQRPARKRKRRRAVTVLKRIGRILRALFIKLGRLIGSGVRSLLRRTYRFLAKLPPKTLLAGIGAMCLVLVSILVLALALPKAPPREVAGGERNVPVAENVPVFPDDPADPVGADDPNGDPDTSDPLQESAVPKPEPTPEPFVPLEKGDDDARVLTVQTRLMDLGYMDPDEPTEHFGSLTEASVEAFQRHNGLTPDGVVGEQTYRMLLEGDPKEYVMQSGDKGEDVEAVQQRLYELGYITTTSNITGNFGEKTAAAVKEFQHRNRLDDDGKVGAKTLEVLYDSDAVSKFYSIGDKSDEIKTFQERLKKLGYYSGKADGEFTRSTASAVRDFQSASGLVVDGNVGPATKTLLLSRDAQSKVIKLGDSGSDVTAMQKRLAELGYLQKKNATGYFGEITEQAVRAFQKRNKLGADGKVGTVTLKTMNASNAKKAATPSSSANESKSGSSNETLFTPSSGSSGGSSGSSGSSNASGIERLIEIAQTKVGCSYVRGAKGPNSFDCSGFVYWCLNQAGVKQSYMTSITWRSCSKYRRIDSMSDLKRGDILVFSGSSMSSGHVGIYMGNGKMIDAGSTEGRVRITSTVLKSGGYWSKHFLMAYRVF